jgi:hypothetical protein
MLGTILIVILILLLIGALPQWGYTGGYLQSSGLGVLVLIIIVLLLMGRV